MSFQWFSSVMTRLLVVSIFLIVNFSQSPGFALEQDVTLLQTPLSPLDRQLFPTTSPPTGASPTIEQLPQSSRTPRMFARNDREAPDTLIENAALSLNSLHPPLIFQKNVGQSERKFPFILRSVNYAVGFTPNAITAAVVRYSPDTEESQRASESKGNAISLTFLDANPANITGEGDIKGTINTFVGQDKRRWHKRIPSYNRLTYRGLYSGVQMSTHSDPGRLEYGFRVEPSADLDTIQIKVDGVRKLSVDRGGNLVMLTDGGPILQTRPRFIEQNGRENKPLKGGFVILEPNVYGFKVERRTPGSRLLVDPQIVFSTYFGGSGNEGMLGVDGGATDFIGRGFDIAIGPDNKVYVIGMTTSADFPATAGAIVGSADVFVMRIDPTLPSGQQLDYAVFIGGSSTERGRSVAPQDDGRVYITGHTDSNDFPTSSGVVQETRAASGAYVSRLDPNGIFEIGTFIGSTASYHPNSLVFNKRPTEDKGYVYVAGSVRSFSESEATDGSFQPDFKGGRFDGFLVKLNADLSNYEYFTYLGGEGRDTIMDLDVNNGFAFVTGSTTSVDFPTTELAAQPQHSQANTGIDCTALNRPRQCFDAFIARFNRNGDELVYSTFMGGNREEYARGIGVSDNNQATITGAARATSQNQTDIFVARLEGGGENFLWDRRLSVRGTDHGEEVVVDRFGRTHFVGTVSIDGLATADTFHGGASDIFYGRVTDTGDDVDYTTYLGGTGADRGFAIAAAGASEENFCVAVAGSTTSDDIQTINPLQGGETRRGGADLLLFTLCDITINITPSDFRKNAPNFVEAREAFTYEVTVTNGGDLAVPVNISDTVPSNVEVAEVTGPGCMRTGNTVTCSFSAPPGSTTILIRVRASEQCPTVVTNTATLRVGSQEFSDSATTRITCPPPECGNGIVEGGEECDSSSNCRSNCTLRRCGDRILDPDEECDGGNNCLSNCTLRRCPDSTVLQPGEACITEACSATGPTCTGNLVCGITCTVVEECVFPSFDLFGFCVGGADTYDLCQTEPSCMTRGTASEVIGD